jgi:histidinol dehydrogenase
MRRSTSFCTCEMHPRLSIKFVTLAVCLSANSLLKGPYRLSPVVDTIGSRLTLWLVSCVYSCGDYASGTNHTLPTYSYARQYSGVSTSTFLKHITSQQLTREGLEKLGPVVAHLADLEGLTAHGNAVRVRLGKLPGV